MEDPHLPEPPPALPALPPDDPAIKAQLTELREKYRRPEMVFVSASVYNHSRTLLSWYPNGNAEKKMSAWSNLDFNCFSGFTTYQIAQTDGTIQKYSLMMSISNVDDVRRREILMKNGNADKAAAKPEIPVLPDREISGPSFVVIEGNIADAASLKCVQGLHDLYRVEGPRMEKAYQERTKAIETRRAYLLAHPPIPKDVAIQFWRRPQPIELKEKVNSATEETP